MRRIAAALAALAGFSGMVGAAGATESAPGPAGPRIINGVTVDAATVPWTVALLRSSVSNGYQAQFCGGTLIDPSWVLTAAHCVTGDAPGSVEVAWGISDLNAIGLADRRDVSEIILHPQYSAALSTSDIALLRLQTPVPGATTLAMNTDPAFPPLNQALDTYGWGNTMYPGSSYPNLLMGVGLLDRSGPGSTATCGAYGADFRGDHMLCAGVSGGGKDACDGDSGGPIVGTLPAGGRTLVGVTSWGNGCALADYPGIWSRVSSYADWVDQKINAPAPPRVHIGNATVVESDSGNRTAFFSVTISPAATGPVSLGYLTGGGTATSGTDYVAKAGTLSFNANQSTKTLTVPVKPDALVEGTEDFGMLLGAPTGSGAVLANSAGTATILDDDAGAGIQLTIGDASTREGDDGTGSVTLKTQVALTTNTGTPFTVPYTMVFGSAGAYDVGLRTGTLSFSGTAKTKTLAFVVAKEWIPEGTESFTVVLGTPSTGAVTVTRGTGTFTIVNDD